MKTVQGYLDLGLVFVSGDKCFKNGASGDEFHRHWHESPAMYSDKIASSFAWRNNDGVKPEYKGLIDVCFECGTVSYNESAIDFEWSLDDENYIAKWRPVVSMHNHTELKPRHSFVTAISIDVPKFWDKSIKPLNCPCVAVNIEAIKPTVSPKEGKPMKPVYTAEMHANGELPPVGAECILIVNDEPRPAKVTYIGKDIVCCSNVDGDAEYACLLGLVSFEPIPKTIKVNGFDVPAPMSEAPENRQMVYLAHAAHLDFNLDFTWQGDDAAASWLSRGLIHSTKSAAIAHAKAMIGIDPNA